MTELPSGLFTSLVQEPWSRRDGLCTKLSWRAAPKEVLCAIPVCLGSTHHLPVGPHVGGGSRLRLRHPSGPAMPPVPLAAAHHVPANHHAEQKQREQCGQPEPERWQVVRERRGVRLLRDRKRLRARH
eukprot:4345394-Prymnesium_polylepis.2